MILSSASSLEQLRSLNTNVKDLFERLSQTQSDIDRQISALYHEIELRDLDEAAGYSAVLILQDALRKRRAAKNEIARLSPIYELLSNNIDAVEARYSKHVARSAEFGPKFTLTMEATRC